MEQQAENVFEAQRLAVAVRGGVPHHTDEAVSREQYFLGGGRCMMTNPAMDWRGSGFDDTVFEPNTTMQMARGVAMDSKIVGKGDNGKRSYNNTLDQTAVSNALPPVVPARSISNASNCVVVDVSPVPTKLQSRCHHQVPDAVSRRVASKELGRMGHSIRTFLNIDKQSE